ncbi:hypothetical protein GCM10009676_08900 [Prauserella halophila]|uniref:Nucleotidyltransferase-like domain-containing protein n=1 Tax=Prauserella halophila TaxID=185641 RepID=A0ABP4GN48_9PSEU|nr:GSU2403 family nucleotidyltransferase fold protein [Prauserella halophila]MCP2235249.1 Nucleotidyltransferase [Prauserella halophila]
MNRSGDTDLLVLARSALLDALDALHDHLDGIVVIGAQAVYLHTGGANVALAEATKDSDVALDPRKWTDPPTIEDVLHAAGFTLDQESKQPGSWLNGAGTPVDLMVPELLAGDGGRRGVRIPPHWKLAARRATGLEAAVVDHVPIRVGALADGDDRVHTTHVAGPGALLVAKLHKLGERAGSVPDRLVDKDAHDVYRLLIAVDTGELAASMKRLCLDPLARPVTEQALEFLRQLFAAGADATGSMMAGRAEEGIGEPATVAASTAILAQDLLDATHRTHA